MTIEKLNTDRDHLTPHCQSREGEQRGEQSILTWWSRARSTEILPCSAVSRVGLNLRAKCDIIIYNISPSPTCFISPHKYLSVGPRCRDKQDRNQDPGDLTPARLGELCESDGIFVNKTQLISQPVRPHFHLVDNGSVAGVWGREEVEEIIKTSFGMFLHSRENSFPCSLYTHSLLMHIHPDILRRRKSLKIRPRDST